MIIFASCCFKMLKLEKSSRSKQYLRQINLRWRCWGLPNMTSANSRIFLPPVTVTFTQPLLPLSAFPQPPPPRVGGGRLHKWKPPCMAVWWKRWWQTRRHNSVHTTELHSPSPSLSQSVALRRLRCSDLPIEVKKVLKKKNCCRRGSGRSAR